MQTINQHPQWHNAPLRLNKEQLQNPFTVIESFFECFHLNDFRELNWRWLVEAISSSSCDSSDPHERNNYFFFYEQLERMVEAAYVLNKKYQKKLRKQRPIKI